MDNYRSPVTNKIIGCAIEVHKTVGPGLLESAYDVCLAKEFSLSGLVFARQVAVPVFYKGADLQCGYRLDFVVENEVVVEVKSVERLLTVHKSQLITYLNLTGFAQGLLFNFNAPLLTAGMISVVNTKVKS